MKTFNELSLKAIRSQLLKIGIDMTDDQFNALTCPELRKIFRKARKAHKLCKEIGDIVGKSKVATLKVPTSEVPMSGKVEFSNIPSAPEGEYRIGDKSKKGS